MADQAATCDCGHLDAVHELATREGRAWFSVEGMEFTPEQVAAAEAEGRLFSYCSVCEDGCPPNNGGQAPTSGAST